ncbi:MAG: hypothetical protein DWQ19_12135 [Crenarchaeota archaeon]|nr:MAG: hypothetical protein DWQ19_12135 [Thermoproteota archaeon]
MPNHWLQQKNEIPSEATGSNHRKKLGDIAWTIPKESGDEKVEKVLLNKAYKIVKFNGNKIANVKQLFEGIKHYTPKNSSLVLRRTDVWLDRKDAVMHNDAFLFHGPVSLLEIKGSQNKSSFTFHDLSESYRIPCRKPTIWQDTE